MFPSSMFRSSMVLACLDLDHPGHKNLPCVCSFQIMVLLSSMDLLEIDFGALTLTHLLFQQTHPVKLTLI